MSATQCKRPLVEVLIISLASLVAAIWKGVALLSKQMTFKEEDALLYIGVFQVCCALCCLVHQHQLLDIHFSESRLAVYSLVLVYLLFVNFVYLFSVYFILVNQGQTKSFDVFISTLPWWKQLKCKKYNNCCVQSNSEAIQYFFVLIFECSANLLCLTRSISQRIKGPRCTQ